MSQARNPLDANESTRPAPPSRAAGGRQAQPRAPEAPRPGWVTFAAIMLFFASGFSVVWAIIAFVQPEWLRNAYQAYGFSTQRSDSAWAWGLLDLLVAAIAVLAGVGVLRGRALAQILGLSVAGLSALRWFFFLPVAPWVALTFIALDVLVVYGLVAQAEYFDTLRLP